MILSWYFNLDDFTPNDLALVTKLGEIDQNIEIVTKEEFAIFREKIVNLNLTNLDKKELGILEWVSPFT